MLDCGPVDAGVRMHQSKVEVPAGDIVAPHALLADASSIDVAVAIDASAVISFFGAL